MSFKNFIESYSHNLAIKVEAVAPHASYTTNLLGFTWGALTFNQWMMVATLILGLLTFATNFYFQYRRNKRERTKAKDDKDLHNIRTEAAKRKDSHRD